MTYISWTEIIYRCNLCLCLEYLKIYEYFKKIIRIKNVQKSQFQKKNKETNRKPKSILQANATEMNLRIYHWPHSQFFEDQQVQI